MYKIKPLVWRQTDENQWESGHRPLGSRFAGEDYFVIAEVAEISWRSTKYVYNASDLFGWVCLLDSLERAKEVCQQQFESRIKRFLEPV